MSRNRRLQRERRREEARRQTLALCTPPAPAPHFPPPPPAPTVRVLPPAPTEHAPPAPTPDPDTRVYTVHELANALKVSRATVDRLESRGDLPGKVMIGGQVRYIRQIVDQWLLRKSYGRTSANATKPRKWPRSPEAPRGQAKQPSTTLSESSIPSTSPTPPPQR